MMKNNLLLDTLHAVEQVEVSFDQTLRTISEINHRYELVTTLKKGSARGRDAYEREIQAAITDSTARSKVPAKKGRKKKATPPKRIKKWRTVSASFECLSEQEDELEEGPAPQMDLEVPYSMYMQASGTQFYHIECNCNIVVPKKTYKERIERLHRAAQQKLQQQCQAFSNRCVNPEPQSPEQDEDLRNCCSYCCPYCCCNCCESY
ncbi:uncharacterized protein [Drosophila pseudoobscura]|uniref:Uncharacterized protein n=1 Tax=Drosophila pseudoobscura pseudoobscura TaxID=46245 RepID=A0A6I8UKL5_DROPS|nr:uncharacterized protein LOC4817619 [Drosophila pseudoobscura]